MTPSSAGRCQTDVRAHAAGSTEHRAERGGEAHTRMEASLRDRQTARCARRGPMTTVPRNSRVRTRDTDSRYVNRPASTHRHRAESHAGAACGGRAFSCAFCFSTHGPGSLPARALMGAVAACASLLRRARLDRSHTPGDHRSLGGHGGMAIMSHGWAMAAHSVRCTSADARPLISSRTPSHPSPPSPLLPRSQHRCPGRRWRRRQGGSSQVEQEEGSSPSERYGSALGWAMGLQAPPSSHSHRGNCQRLPAPLQSIAHGAPAASHVKFGIPLLSANDARRCCRRLVLSCLALPCKHAEAMSKAGGGPGEVRQRQRQAQQAQQAGWAVAAWQSKTTRARLAGLHPRITTYYLLPTTHHSSFASLAQGFSTLR